ncbi:MAG: ABC transporter permease [Verrucomicrobia bacterium]|nr:ABC transporter permease [Verrucomicrobiota bacterium]
MSPDDAAREARKRFGNLQSVREECRERRGASFGETTLQDLRFAFRQLLKNPGFTAVAVLTLALGIGANAVVFSVARTVLFRPLGFEGEDRLMWIQLVNTQTGASENQLSWQDLDDIRAATQSFEAVATDNSSDADWEDGDRTERVPAVRATPHLIDALRLRPALGRMLQLSDADADAEPVALISHELWQSRFAGSPDVVGQSVRVDKEVRTIVGVLPPGVRFPIVRAPQSGSGSIVKAGVKPFWLPMSKPRGEDGTSRSARMFLGIGRLKPGVSEARARVELAALGKRLAGEHPESNRNWSFTVLSFRDQVFGRTRQGIPLLAAAVAAVLLICCVNLANLLLARGVVRQRELAVRLALGAGRARLVRALMTESVLLALLGGGAGVAFAQGALQIIRHLAATTVPFIREATLDGTAVAFTVGLSLLTALIFGLLPALRQSRAEATDVLRTGTRSTGGPQIRAWQQGLLVGQIAVALVLLASAGLLLESFRRLIGQDLGYQPRSVITMDLGQSGFASNGDVCRMYRALRERLAALPGVEAVGTISSVPLMGKWTFSIKAHSPDEPKPEAERPALAAGFIAFDYFQAMDIPLLDGRHFRNDELRDDGYGSIVILNQSAATLLFPNRSAVGRRLNIGASAHRIYEVIGVVKDTRDVRLEEKPQPRLYWHYAFGGAQVVVRGKAPASMLTPMLRDAVQQTDARVRIDGVRSMTEIVASTVAERRFLMIMVAAYAAIALAIAAIGIFGVVAYQVAQRTNEFGVRLALGATPGGLLRLVLWQAGRVAVIGLLAGLAISFATNRLLESQIFGLTPHDPFLLASVTVLLLAVALLASLLPARRAARTNPMEALRHE